MQLPGSFLHAFHVLHPHPAQQSSRLHQIGCDDGRQRKQPVHIIQAGTSGHGSLVTLRHFFAGAPAEPGSLGQKVEDFMKFGRERNKACKVGK